jgi:uncharacterized membrane protein
MGFYIKLFAATLAVFLIIDLAWLSLVARGLYQKQLGFLLAPSTKWLAAVLFYLLFVLGLLVFVVVPGLEAGSLGITLLRAALYGLITYATYDLTNLATVKDWPILITVVDLGWGTILSTVVSLLSYSIGRLMS